MKYTFLWLALAMGILAALPSCKKLVEIGEPDDVLVRSKIFNSNEAANAAVVDMYSKMVLGLRSTNGYLIKLPALYADELTPATADEIPEDLPFYNNALLPDNTTIESSWSHAYAVIYVANAVLEGLSASTAVSDSLKQEMMGEARFVRALNYFYLVNLFGKVPLVLSTDYRKTSYSPRSPELEVYQQIITDLHLAASLLPAVRNRPGAAAPGNIRATKWAAMAMLARVHLYQKDWAAASTMATNVIESGMFTLCADPDQTFLAGSPETLFQWQPVTTDDNSIDALFFLSASGTPPYAATASFLKSLEPGDDRKSAWLDSADNGGGFFFYPYKYKIRSGTPAKEYSVVLRLAEMYLVRAEANARLGILQGAKGALADLDLIRTRAKLSPLPPTLNGVAVMAAIEQERRVEFFAEWAHRWLDLKRWPGIQNPALTRAHEVMMVQKPAVWKPFQELWPIPVHQLALNNQLTQNPGYQ